jgi:hypothetical protein
MNTCVLLLCSKMALALGASVYLPLEVMALRHQLAVLQRWVGSNKGP